MAELNYSKKRLEPIITKYGIDVENDKVFHAIITLFPGQTDYQMWGVKAVFDKAISLDSLIATKEWADANPTEIAHLSRKNLVLYKTKKNFSMLNTEISNINAVMLVKRSINRFNTSQRHILTEAILTPIAGNEYCAMSASTFSKFHKLFKDFETLPQHRQKKFITLMSAVRSLSEIEKHLVNANQESYEWNREDMLSYAQRCCPDTEVCYDKNGVVILRVPSFESSRKLCGNGRTSWCLTREASYFKRYTAENGNAQQFFLFDFNKKESHELAHVGFSVAPNKGINYAHSTRNNSLMSGYNIDGRSWNIHSVLEHHHIAKNVYVRLKQLVNYKWTKESFLEMISSKHIVANQVDENRFIVPLESTSIYEAVAGHTLVGSNVVNNNSKSFAVLDFGKDLNDEASVLVFSFAKDKYDVLSFSTSYDAYGATGKDAKALGKHNLTSDMFVKIGDINPNILLHKLIDEQNIAAATKLLAENKDIDPNTMFYGSMPVIKAITARDSSLFAALANHEKFDMSLTEGFGEPYIQFIMLYIETLIEDKNIDLTPLFEMAYTFIGNEKYDINALDVNGDSALHVACEMPEMSAIVERLVTDPRCDVNLKNEWGYVPLDVALDNSPVNMVAVKALLSRPDLTINEDTMKFAKEKGIDLNALRETVMAEKAAKEAVAVAKAQTIEVNEANEYADVFAKAFAK